ncbi:MAG: hypothetical protein HC836_45265 [Richelia sp. RM2_1_2]|nr:hypothetical protein [Richelia sp. RM2_1_2]
MNLYTVVYDDVSQTTPVYILREEEKTLPTHIIAANTSNALETALSYCTTNFQLNKCTLVTENVKLVTERMNNEASE